MSATTFSVNWDYRCPFARNAHEHLVTALENGAPFDVTFVGFSLSQVHFEEDDTSVWEEPEKDSGIIALQVGIVVRDRLPEKFLAIHRAIFALRHDQGGDLRDEQALRALLGSHDVDGDFVFAEIASGWPLEVLQKEHESSVSAHDIWGVPTFVSGDEAVFVRLMTRPDGDASRSRATIEHVLELVVGMPELNEFKHTSIPR